MKRLTNSEQENRKMAVINLTCDYPNEYCAATLARWAGLSKANVKRLVDLLDLDIQKDGRHGWNIQRINEKLKDYLPKSSLINHVK